MEVLADDVVLPNAYQNVHAGFVRVGDEPGLGVTLDHAMLAKVRYKLFHFHRMISDRTISDYIHTYLHRLLVVRTSVANFIP